MSRRTNARLGTIAEAWVRDVLEAELRSDGGGWVLHLSQNGPADVVALGADGRWSLHEVKSSRRRARARRSALSEEESRLRSEVDAAGQVYEVWRIHRSGHRCEPLARERTPSARTHARTRASEGP